MEVSAIMTPLPVTIGSDSSLETAIELMDAHEIRHLPVVDDGRLVGIVSDRDLYGRTGWTPGRSGQAPDTMRNNHREQPIASAMHPAVRVLDESDDVIEAAAGIAELRVGCLPVTRQGTLIGIVTEIDILGLYERSCREGQIPADQDPPVKRHMSDGTDTVAIDTPMDRALALCDELRVHHLPVTEGTDIVGMVSDRDLARGLGRGLGRAAVVAELMTERVVTIEHDERMSKAAAMLRDEKIGALPVVEDGRLAGILTMSDLMPHCVDSFRASEAFAPA